MEVNDNTLILDPDAPTIDVKIHGTLIVGFQVDIGSSVSLLSMEKIKELGLTGSYFCHVNMEDQTRTKTLGQLFQVIVG